eukprot:jgi/Bigna1/82269/fgenesh1_pg.90_\
MAIKQIPCKREDDFKSILREINVMKRLNHKNIIKFLGYKKRKEDIQIFMDLVAGGQSISSISKELKGIPEEATRRYVKQIVQALAYCHRQNIIHRDLKGQNILVTCEGVVKLCDFGSAKKHNALDANYAKTVSFHHTQLWTAPEIILDKSEEEEVTYTSTVDTWSLGCTVIEAITGRVPWDEQLCGGGGGGGGGAQDAASGPDELAIDFLYSLATYYHRRSD